MRVALGSIAVLVVPLCWRGYVLFVRPDLFGRYRKIGDGDVGAGSASGVKCE